MSLKDFAKNIREVNNLNFTIWCTLKYQVTCCVGDYRAISIQHIAGNDAIRIVRFSPTHLNWFSCFDDQFRRGLFTGLFGAAEWIAVFQVTCSWNADIALFTRDKCFTITSAPDGVTILIQAAGQVATTWRAGSCFSRETIVSWSTHITPVF